MRKYFFIICIVVAVSAAQFAFAQNSIISDDTVCKIGGGAPNCTFADLTKLLETGINFLIKLAIPVAAIGFGFAGFLYIADQGSGAKRKQANEIFYWTFVGFMWILGAWLIVSTILKGLGVGGAFNLLR